MTHVPDHYCPSCGQKLEYQKSRQAFRCVNPDCGVHRVDRNGVILAQASTAAGRLRVVV